MPCKESSTFGVLESLLILVDPIDSMPSLFYCIAAGPASCGLTSERYPPLPFLMYYHLYVVCYFNPLFVNIMSVFSLPSLRILATEII